MIKIQVEEMIDALLNKDEVLFQMVSLLKEGYSKPEIKEMLGIPKLTFYDNWGRIRKIAVDYIDF